MFLLLLSYASKKLFQLSFHKLYILIMIQGKKLFLFNKHYSTYSILFSLIFSSDLDIYLKDFLIEMRKKRTY
jgi:hypothetical protein